MTGGKGADLVIRGNVVLNKEKTRGEEIFIRDDSQDQEQESWKLGPFIPTLQALALSSVGITHGQFLARIISLWKLEDDGRQCMQAFSIVPLAPIESHLLSAFGDLGVHVAAGRRSCTTTGSS
jgi:hypothetical protein